jgi:hypothetical protein
MVELENIHDVIHVSKGVSALDEEANRLLRASNSLWNLVNVLRLHNGLEVILEKLGL